MSEKLAHGFNGAKLKIIRANRHINELIATIDGIGRGDDDKVILSSDGNEATVIGINQLGFMGQQIPLMIGDCIHNLRSALDHIWTALWNESGKSGFGTFPFHETRQNLVDAVAKSPVKQSFPAVERLLLDSLKPHSDHGGDHVFWTITKFDKLDKHNFLIPTFSINKFEKLTIKTPGGTANFDNLEITGFTVPILIDGIGEYQNKGKVTLEVAFPSTSVLPNEPVIPTLIYMRDATQEAVELFSKTFISI